MDVSETSHFLAFNIIMPDYNYGIFKVITHKRIFISIHIRGILSQQPKTEWKCAYNELLFGAKGLQHKDDQLSGPTRKRSKTSTDVSNDFEAMRKERQRVRFKETKTTDSEAETSTCPTCLQVIAKDSNDYDCLMEKSVN